MKQLGEITVSPSLPKQDLFELNAFNVKVPVEDIDLVFIENVKIKALELLTSYYQPLISYSHFTPLSEPLWQLRQMAIKERGITEKLQGMLQEGELLKHHPELALLVQLTIRCQDTWREVLSFSQLSLDEKLTLIQLSERKEYGTYATSLLVTLFLRDSSTHYRRIALKLLKKERYKKPLKLNSHVIDLNLELSSTDLLEIAYIDFSYATSQK